MSVLPRARRSPTGVVLTILGGVLALVALCLLAGGATLAVVDRTQPDANGYYSTSTQRFATEGYAITQDDVDVANVIDLGDLARVRISAASTTDHPVFIGIARAADAEAYLAGVARATLRDVDVDPFTASARAVSGSTRPAPPATQRIWVASASGSGRQTLTWPVREGHWTVVAMNADATRGVEGDTSVGVRFRHVGWAVVGLLALGALVLAAAVLLIVRGGRRHGDGDADAGAVSVGASPAPAVAERAYPLAVSARLDDSLSRGLWLVKWLLVIPHMIVLAGLWLVFALLTVVAWAAVLVTGRYPRGIFDVNLGVLRWSWRVGFYAFDALGTDRYPPFSLRREPDYPATLDIAYPQRSSRALALVRLVLAIPHLLVVGVFAGGGAYLIDGADGWKLAWPWSGLIGLLALIAGFALLFTARYPRGLFDLVVGLNRWVLRVVAYVALLTDVYPPFRLDSGGEEPRAEPVGAVPAAT